MLYGKEFSLAIYVVIAVKLRTALLHGLSFYTDHRMKCVRILS